MLPQTTLLTENLAPPISDATTFPDIIAMFSQSVPPLVSVITLSRTPPASFFCASR